MGSKAPARRHRCEHRGAPVRVGPYEVYAAGTYYLQPSDFRAVRIVVPLTGNVPFKFSRHLVEDSCVLPDFGGVPDNWEQLLRERIIPHLESGFPVMAFCMASHGRTGTFLASLIALLESAEETPDPIAAVRQRHCHEAVETLAQAEGIFALRGQEVPQKYKDEFARSAVPQAPSPEEGK